MVIEAADQLEQLRRLARRHGIPMDALDQLAVRQSKVARLLDVSLRKVEQMCADGELPVVDVGGSPRIPMVDVLAYLESHRREPRAARAKRVRAPGPAPGETAVQAQARAILDAAAGKRG